jgi:hypothetical protein
MDLNTQINHDATLIERSLFIEKTRKLDTDVDGEKNIQASSLNTKKSSIKNDLSTIAFLICVYFLQGVPLGLASAIPMILAERKVSYQAQGTFSFALYPFSVKLLWAPIVDSMYDIILTKV